MCGNVLYNSENIIPCASNNEMKNCFKKIIIIAKENNNCMHNGNILSMDGML